MSSRPDNIKVFPNARHSDDPPNMHFAEGFSLSPGNDEGGCNPRDAMVVTSIALGA